MATAPAITDYIGLHRLAVEPDHASPIGAGTARTRSPAATRAAAQPWFGPAGLTRVGDLTGLDRIGIPVFQAVRPNAKSLSVSQGKGADPLAAEVSAIMEALELWCAEEAGAERTASVASLLGDGADVVDVAALPGARRRLPDDVQLLWARGVDLATGGPVWVPHGVVSMDETGERDPLLDHVTVTTSGLASGNTPLEAIAHGLFEVIERDAWALAGQRAGPRRLDLGTVTGDTARGLLDTCSDAGFTVVLSDISGDLPVPVVLAELVPTDPDPHRVDPVGAGLGCHGSAEIAICRAVSEAAQSRLTAIAGARDDMVEDPAAAAEAADMLRSYARQPATRGAEDLPTTGPVSVAAQATRALALVQTRPSTRCVAVDLTPGGADFAVVRLIVPGFADDRTSRW